MSIDMLNINYTVVLAEFSNSYGDGNGRHGHVANMPHLLDLYSNRVPAPGRPPVPGSPSESRKMAVVQSTYGSREKSLCNVFVPSLLCLCKVCLPSTNVVEQQHEGSIVASMNLA